MRRWCLWGVCFGVLVLSVGVAVAKGGDRKAVTWAVEIVQDGQVVKSDNQGRLRINRAPFTIRVTLPAPETVMLNVTDNPELQTTINPGWSLQRCDTDSHQGRSLPFCPGTGMAEYPRNQKERLFLKANAHHHLYYQGPDKHYWSRVTHTAGGGVVFERVVKSLNGDEVALASWGGEALHMIFLVDLHKDAVVHADELKELTLLLRPAG